MKSIEKRMGKYTIRAEESDQGLELNLEGETFAVLECDELTGSFRLVAYGDKDEPEFDHIIKL
ncbi:hypothetical protein P4284_23790 [Bacillus swezeyi]|uniref:hypothetical protein n=1 Tax=Bacillus swezeyi TaxID=1925020 RepID=UPI002E244367|nr:hypothetical protein [Bacillus swezeyi]MED2979675.1 hypothetical protein [Bacillus swezeyi]